MANNSTTEMTTPVAGAASGFYPQDTADVNLHKSFKNQYFITPPPPPPPFFQPLGHQATVS